jgi:precorrin-8X/cobalt-precorrin-8 methylmutase
MKRQRHKTNGGASLPIDLRWAIAYIAYTVAAQINHCNLLPPQAIAMPDQSLQSIASNQQKPSDRATQPEPKASIIHPITAQSFAIIDREIGKHSFNRQEYEIVRRVIHTTADFEFKNLIKFSPHAIEQGLKAITSGKAIVVDVGMVRQGIAGLVNKTFGNAIINALDYADMADVSNVSSDVSSNNLKLEPLSVTDCANNLSNHHDKQAIDDVAVSEPQHMSENIAADLATGIKAQTTRSGRGMYICAKQHPDAIFVVGNAPTALLSLCRLAQSDRHFAPSLIIGVPVGFVSVVEAKTILAQSRLSHILSQERKGGSPVAAAIINALITLAW